MLAILQAVRPAVLRRSLKKDSLYATDIPVLLQEEQLKQWLGMAASHGWIWRQEGNWILLDRRIPDEFTGRYNGPFGNEASCCASLLERGRATAESADERRSLIKAGEEGPAAFEKTCGGLHTEWAERLRKNEPLPDIPSRWFKNT